YNNDGWEDLYISYANNVAVFENGSNHLFTNEITVYQDSNLIMGAIQTADIDNQAGLDYVWSGGNNTIAFHINQSNLSIDDLQKNRFNIFPNPTNGIVNFTKSIESVSVYDIAGKVLRTVTNKSFINLSGYPAGVYFLIIKHNNEYYTQKLINN